MVLEMPTWFTTGLVMEGLTLDLLAAISTIKSSPEGVLVAVLDYVIIYRGYLGRDAS